MKINLATIEPFLLYQFSSESELVQAIEEISHKFNFERGQIGDYAKDEKLVAAYTCFYALTNIPKLREVWNLLGNPDFSDYEVIDIGSGPATFSLALLNQMQLKSIFLLEKSELMRKQALALLEGFFPDTKTVIYEDGKSVPSKTKSRLGLFGHSANEMSVEQVVRLVKKLELDEVLFIEPGTMSYFKNAILIREKLIEMGHEIHFPCPGQAPCPLVGQEDWCHQYLELRHEADVERLCQLTKKDRRRVPILIHYFKRAKKKSFPVSRIVRRFKPLKYAQPFQVCEDSNTLFKIEVLYKGLSKAQKKQLESLLAGDRVEYILEKVLPDGTKRVTWKI